MSCTMKHLESQNSSFLSVEVAFLLTFPPSLMCSFSGETSLKEWAQTADAEEMETEQV